MSLTCEVYGAALQPTGGSSAKLNAAKLSFVAYRLSGICNAAWNIIEFAIQ